MSLKKVMQLIALSASVIAVAGIRGPGIYNGVVIFDRWGACYLYSGVYLMPVSEKVKEGLRNFQGQAVRINATEVFQPMNPGDALIQKFQMLGQAPDPTGPRSFQAPKVDGIQLVASARFASNGRDELTIEVLNQTGEHVRVRSDSLAPTILAKKIDKNHSFLDPADGASYAAVTRTPITSAGGGSRAIDGKTYRVRLELARGAAIGNTIDVGPHASVSIPLVFELPEGEYQFLAGYGGGVHEFRSVASNLVSFNVGKDGRAHEISGADTLIPSVATRRQHGTICGEVSREDGGSVRDAYVALWPFPRPAKSAQAAYAMRLKGDGAYRFEEVRPGRYLLSAFQSSASGAAVGFFGAYTLATAVPVTPGESTGCIYKVSLRRQPSYTLSGRLGFDGGPQADDAPFVVTIKMLEGEAYPFQQRAVADKAGMFRFNGVPVGHYFLHVAAGGFGSGWELEVTGDQWNLDQSWERHPRIPGAAIPGRVYESVYRDGRMEQRVLSETESNEYNARQMLRTLQVALTEFSEMYKVGFPASLAVLGPPPSWYRNSAMAAGLFLHWRFLGYPGDTPMSFVNSGYRYTYQPGARDANGVFYGYSVTARPELYPTTGARSFFLDETAIMRVTGVDRPATPNDPVAKP